MIKKLKKLLTTQSTDAILIDNFSDCAYLLDIYKTIPRGEARANLLIYKDKLTLITDPLSRSLISTLLNEKIEVIIGDGYRSMYDHCCFFSEIKKSLADNRCKKVLCSSNRLKPANWGKIKFKSLEKNPITDFANTGTDKEQHNLRKAVKIVDDVFDKIAGEIRDGITEIQLRNRIEELMYNYGADSITFSTIVAFGKHTNQIHAISDNRKLKMNDLVMLDYGAVVDGVGSDITRTFVLGKASSDQKSMWNAVFEAQKLSLDVLAPGKTGKAIDKISRDTIKKHGYGDFYFHTLGHQLGLLSGDFLLAPWETRKVKKNMLLTVEPGVYTKNGGVRIEDDVLVTKNGIEILTKSTKVMEV